MSKSKVSITYGMIEARVRVPDLNLGGWPAVWLLGTANYAWPRCGEIDLMEMGSKQAFRNLHDTHNGGNGARAASGVYYGRLKVGGESVERKMILLR